MPQRAGRRFMQETCYEYLDVSDQSKRLPQPPLELNYDHALPTFALPAWGIESPLHSQRGPIPRTVISVRSPSSVAIRFS